MATIRDFGHVYTVGTTDEHEFDDDDVLIMTVEMLGYVDNFGPFRYGDLTTAHRRLMVYIGNRDDTNLIQAIFNKDRGGTKIYIQANPDGGTFNTVNADFKFYKY